MSSSSRPAVAANSITGRLRDINDRYHVCERVIGTGYHSTVRECVDLDTGRRCAVKSVRKGGRGVRQTNLRREVRLLREVGHENVLELVDVFEDSERLHLVTDLYGGGELFGRIKDRLLSSRTSCFEEREAAAILRQVLKALSYLHSRDIVHRDIKPENIVFETADEDSPVRIVDFGLARKHYRDSFEPHMSTVAGTPHFLAPEVLKQKYDKSCDLWSVGVIAFVMLGGYFPFDGGTDGEVHRAVRQGAFHFRSEYWSGVSRRAKNFVRRLLRANPRRRMTIEQALGHPWMVEHGGPKPKDDGRRDGIYIEAKTLRRRDSFGSVGQLKVRFSRFRSCVVNM